MAKRIYEVMIAFDTTLPVADADALIEKLRGMVVEGKGEVKMVEKIGFRKLAFKVKGKAECNMAVLTCDMPSEIIPPIEAVLKLHEGVIRYMTTRLDPALLAPQHAAPTASANINPPSPATALPPPVPPTV